MTRPALEARLVERARETLRPHLLPTPLRRSFAFDRPPVYLKLECWQPTGSFKVRGATNVLASLGPEARRRGVVAASAGSHALGVAFAAQALGGAIRATLFVPHGAPRSKVAKLRRFPVELREVGSSYDQAYAAARAWAEATDAAYVHAFDDPLTAAGAGTVGLEILEQQPEVGTIVVPVGGGGLIAGLACAVKARRPDVRVVAVQPEASPALGESLRLGRPLYEYAARPTLADALAGGIGELAFAARDLIDEVVTVGEAEIEDAIATLVTHDQVLAEASGAVGVAALRSAKVRGLEGRPAAVVITGGNLDAQILARILHEHERA